MRLLRRFSIKSVLAAIGLIFWGAACGSTAAPSEGMPETPPLKLAIFAAASLTEVMDEMAPGFQATVPGISLDLNLAGSQELRTQLEHGARGDVFLSADPRQMDISVEAGLVQGKPVVFTTNSMVALFADGYGPAIAAQGPRGGQSQLDTLDMALLKSLAGSGVSLALALPDVPAGAYARDAIRKMGTGFEAEVENYAGKVMANVVTMETNVRGVATKVALGEVDAGIVYLTDAGSEFVAEHTRQVPIPPDANQQARYLAAALKTSRQPDLAAEFVEFLLADKGQKILRSHGFGPLPRVSNGFSSPENIRESALTGIGPEGL